MPHNKYYLHAFKITRCLLLCVQAITVVQVIISHNVRPEKFIALLLCLSAACILLTCMLFLPFFHSYRRSNTLYAVIGLQGGVIMGGWNATFPENIFLWAWIIASITLTTAGLLLNAEENELKPKSRL